MSGVHLRGVVSGGRGSGHCADTYGAVGKPPFHDFR